MHRPHSALVLVASLSLLVRPSWADPPPELDRARALLDQEKAAEAAVLLEDALPGASTDPAAVLELLRRSYALAARQAEAAGRAADAAMYRDNLEILNRKPRARSSPVAVPPTEPVVSPAAPSRSEAPTLEGGSSPRLPRATEEPAAPARETLSLPNVRPGPPRAAEDPASIPLTPVPVLAPPPGLEGPARPVKLATQPVSTPSAPGPSPNTRKVDVAAADAAFRSQHYGEAGRIDAALDREHRLPAARRDHWAYCRWVDVVRRINAKPNTPEEWASIDAEIKRIRELSPNNWFGEYLRNRAADRPSSRRKRARGSNQVVVRGSSPDETPAAGSKPSRPSPPPSRPADRPAPAPRPTNRSPAPAPPVQAVPWQVLESTNFRILHTDAGLAGRVGPAAEAARDAQLKRWAGSAPRDAWSPKCEIYLYPTAQVFSQATGQPEPSPGFSTMGLQAGRVIARRVNLRADHPNLIAAILPHEITHVVLADLFSNQQIPRWADEGMAVLAEPHGEQRLRAADLEQPLTSGRVFRLQDLMVMDYPADEFWGLYYAQSVSLTRFLVEQGTPAQFIQFVQGSQRNNHEAELKRIYQIEGYAELQKRWLAYARNQTAALTASSSDPAHSPPPSTSR